VEIERKRVEIERKRVEIERKRVEIGRKRAEIEWKRVALMKQVAFTGRLVLPKRLYHEKGGEKMMMVFLIK
jgi:hypothetical protein